VGRIWYNEVRVANTNTNQTSTSGAAAPAITGRGDAIYDSIMSQIEPELTTLELPLLVEKYKDETSEQAKARGERYAKAFEEYDRIFTKLQQGWDAQLAKYQHESLASTEKEMRQQEEAQISGLEQAISDT